MSGQPLLLTDWVLPDSTAKRYATDHIESPSGQYYGWLLGAGSLRMELPHPPGLPISGAAKLSYSNIGREFSMLRNAYYLEGTEVTLKFGYEGNSAASFSTLFTGIIRSEDAPEEMIYSISLRDNLSIALDVEVEGVITNLSFPRYKRGQPWTFKPILFGQVVDWPCPYVDTDSYWFLVAQSAIARVRNVKVYGQIVGPSNYEILEATIDGKTHTVVRFFSDPEESGRSPDIPVVTVDAWGETDDGTSSGTVITNPAEVLKAYYNRYVQGPVTLDASSFSAAAALIKEPFSGGIIRKQKHSQFISRLLSNFGIDQHVNSSGNIAISKLQTSSLWAITRGLGDSEIDVGSWKSEPREEIANRISYGLDYYWAGSEGGYFQNYESLDNETTQAFMGRVAEATEQVNLWFTRETTPGMNLAYGILRWFGPKKDRVTLTIPLVVYIADGFPLGEAVSITHFEGTNSAGKYSSELFKIVGSEIDLRSLAVRLKLIRLNQSTTKAFRLTARAQALAWTTATPAQQDFYGFLSFRTTGKYSDSTDGKPLYLR